MRLTIGKNKLCFEYLAPYALKQSAWYVIFFVSVRCY